MDFIIGLAHFCEIHGPTSILCTQAIPPTCSTCFPLNATILRSHSAPQSGCNVQTPPGSSHGHNQSTNATPLSKYVNQSARGSRDTTPICSSTAISPSDTPPSSPRSPLLATPMLSNPSTSGTTSATVVASKEDACRNCSISFPKAVNDSLMGVMQGNTSDARGISTSQQSEWGKKAPLRSTETVFVGVPKHSNLPEEYPRSAQITYSSPKCNPPVGASGGVEENPHTYSALGTWAGFTTHPHTITYLSSHSPAIPSRYATVRQSCVRTLSCEMIPAQTCPMLFGDPIAGHTIALVFRLVDTKARGGRRTYALLCMSPNQKALIRCWNAVTDVFQNLVCEIQHAAAEKAAKDVQSSSSLGSSMSSVTFRGPEGFLRRRAPNDGASQKTLAELIGREDFFVDLHAKFVCLLSKLTKIYGHEPVANHDSSSAAVPLPLAYPPDTRSRAGSLSSTIGGDDFRDRQKQSSHIPHPSTSVLSSTASNKTIQPHTSSTPLRTTHNVHAGSASSNPAMLVGPDTDLPLNTEATTGSQQLSGSKLPETIVDRHDRGSRKCSDPIGARRKVAVGY